MPRLLERIAVMTQSNIQSAIEKLPDCFEMLLLTPPDWPVVVSAALAEPQVVSVWPGFPTAAMVAAGRMGHGRGQSAAESWRSALGELVEIASCCDWGDLAVQRGTVREIGPGGWAPARLNGFSDSQRADRAAWNRHLEGVDRIAGPCPDDTPLDWIAAQRANGEDVLVPADFAIIGRRQAGDPAATSIADTNGCAAGPTAQAARLAALCELVERDATARWWYGRWPCRAMPVDGLAAEVGDWLARRGRRLAVFDITSDIAIPTVAALASDRDGSCLSLGFATRVCADAALQAAVMELMQLELKLFMIRGGALPEAELGRWLREVRLDHINLAAGPPRDAVPSSDMTVAGALDLCTDAVTRAGVELAFVDMTRPEFRVPVVRAISPDLCHWKPRFGRERLLSDGHDRVTAPLLRL